MPGIPIIVPVIVLGLLFGSMIRPGKRSIAKKRFIVASVVSGVANSGYAYVLTVVSPPGQLASNLPSVVSNSQSTTAELVFVATSFLAGFLLVLAVLAVAAIYLRLRGPETLEEQAVQELAFDKET